MNRENYNTYIFDKLSKIMKDLFEIDLDKVDERFFKDSLLEYNERFKARHLVYLLFEIEKEFNISIPEENIINKRFSCMTDIIGIINEQLETCQGEEENAG